ncbi:hypothetical protein BaRGS_00022641 [Batillaria attramentaria]|uniref:Uncharacterized protein n=1 Tax=Batillaria attramentaria TaxID=370345 RepID=A0ABD0KG56_9CAEN
MCPSPHSVRKKHYVCLTTPPLPLPQHLASFCLALKVTTKTYLLSPVTFLVPEEPFCLGACRLVPDFSSQNLLASRHAGVAITILMCWAAFTRPDETFANSINKYGRLWSGLTFNPDAFCLSACTAPSACVDQFCGISSRLSGKVVKSHLISSRLIPGRTCQSRDSPDVDGQEAPAGGAAILSFGESSTRTLSMAHVGMRWSLLYVTFI